MLSDDALWALAGRLCETWWALAFNMVRPFLWHNPEKRDVQVSAVSPGDGWVLASKEMMGLSWTRPQAKRWLVERLRSLPLSDNEQE